MLSFHALKKYVVSSFLLVALTACQTTPSSNSSANLNTTSDNHHPRTATTNKTLTVQNIKVGKVIAVKSEKQTIWGAKGAELDNIVVATQDAVSRKLSTLQGSKTVDIKIHVIQYHVGFGSPVFGTKFELLDPETGKSLSPLKRNWINANHFDGGNLFVSSPIATQFDAEYPAMVGLYARKFEGRLQRFLSSKKDEIRL